MSVFNRWKNNGANANKVSIEVEKSSPELPNLNPQTGNLNYCVQKIDQLQDQVEDLSVQVDQINQRHQEEDASKLSTLQRYGGAILADTVPMLAALAGVPPASNVVREVYEDVMKARNRSNQSS